MTDPKALIAEMRNDIKCRARWNIGEKANTLDRLAELEAWVDAAQGEIQEYEKGAEI